MYVPSGNGKSYWMAVGESFNDKKKCEDQMIHINITKQVCAASQPLDQPE
jgi:hypothetical protein